MRARMLEAIPIVIFSTLLLLLANAGNLWWWMER